MASRIEIADEIARVQSPDQFDVVRRRKLRRVHEITGRDTIIYAVDFPGSNPIKAQLAGGLSQLSLADKDGFDEVTRNLAGPHLDVVLHSPGGSAEATESIVQILRARFTGEIRFIVPNLAKSAATMLAMSGDSIIIDERSELGPTDPQMLMVRDRQQIVAPAQAIKDQFKMAHEQINGDPAKLPGWVPLLQQYGPSLLAECDNHIQLAEKLVSQWLAKYMFAGDPAAGETADRIAAHLSNHNNFHSHGRHIGINELKQLGVKIHDMREDIPLREAVTDLYIATMLTFDGTGAVKIVENHINDAHIMAVHIEAQAQVTPFPAQQDEPRHVPNQGKPGQQLPRGKRRK